MTVYIDGFLAIAHAITKAGQYNPAIAIIVTIAVVAVFLIMRRFPVWLVGVLFLAFILMAILSVRDESDLDKLFRDYIYLILLVTAFEVVKGALRGGIVDLRIFARWLGLLVLLLFPILGVISGIKGYDNRFAGFTLSPPIFANAALLAYLIARNARLGWMWTFIFFIASVACIVLSGTRSPLVTLVLYEMFLFGTGELASRNRGIYYILLALGIAVISLVLFDLYTTITIGHSSSRIFSSEDSDGGSLQTRSAWYLLILNGLRDSFFIGGYGAGAAERLTGFITHFDILRYWYDYSVFYVGIFFFILWKAFRCNVTDRGSHTTPYRIFIFPFVCISTILMSMHNIFQSPGMIVIFAGYLNCSNIRKGR